MVTAGLFVQTLNGLYAKGPGFDTKNLMMFSLEPDLLGHSYAQAEGVMRETFRRLRELPEIERVAIANSQILNGGSSSGNVTIQAEERRVSDPIAHRMRVTPGFFATLGVPIVAGRDFDERDMRPPGTEPGPYRKAIVNETFARRYFGARSPLGAHIGIGNRPDTETNIEIIGVVREVSRRNLRDQDLDQIFLDFWDNQSENGAFFVRVRNPESAAAAIRAIVAGIDPRLPVNNMTTLDDQIDRALSNERALATLSTGFGVLALVISIVGLYGVMAFVAAQRRQEIGLRVALGATRRDAVWLVVRDALMMVAVGIAVALPAVWALRQLIETQLFGVTAFDGPTIAVAAASLALIALAAAMLPAWRASRLDPNAVLRVE
jgi:predicted permease